MRVEHASCPFALAICTLCDGARTRRQIVAAFSCIAVAASKQHALIGPLSYPSVAVVPHTRTIHSSRRRQTMRRFVSLTLVAAILSIAAMAVAAPTAPRHATADITSLAIQ